MIKIIIEALKLAPRFLWQLYIQPSKVYAFVKADRKNIYTSTWAFFFIGILVGTILAIPHYFFLHYNPTQTILSVLLSAFTFIIRFAFRISFSFVIAFALSGLFTLSGKEVDYSYDSYGERFSVIFGIIIVVLFVNLGLGVIVGISVIVFAFGNFTTKVIGSSIAVILFMLEAFTAKKDTLGTGITTKFIIKIINQPTYKVIATLLFLLCVVLFFRNFKRKKKTLDRIAPLIFSTATAFLHTIIIPYQPVSSKFYNPGIFLISFLTGHLILFLLFDKKNKLINLMDNSDGVEKIIKLRQLYNRIQKSYLWGLVLCFLIFPFFYSIKKGKFDFEFYSLISGIAFLSLSISHVVDYFICRHLWSRQRKQILDKNKTKVEVLISYENSILFKHERLFFPLPGLYKVMLHFAGNREWGFKEAVNRIMHLYRFTFQHKQAEKAVLELAKNKEMTHLLFLSILEYNGIPLIEIISTANPLASLYYALSDIENNKRLTVSMRNIFFISPSIKKPKNIILSWLQSKDFFKTEKEMKKEFTPKPLEERIEIVCKLMSTEKGYLYNEEMIKTLQACLQLLKSENLKDISRAIGTLQEISKFPLEIKYFSFFDLIMPRLNRIKESIQKIDSIERIETRRSVLYDQKYDMSFIMKNAMLNLFKPFSHIWLQGFVRCQQILDHEAKILQGSAVLSIQLKNNDIPASEEERKLYFEISNKGQELASHVRILIRTISPGISFPGGLEIVDFIESGKVKEISFPIKAGKPIETTVQGTLTFSDRISIDKQTSFSFPIYVRQSKVEFIKIKNSYIIGQPLKGETPLFYGREDAHDFIDENILASGDHHTFVCHGLRRSGKTSLLYRIETHGFTDKRLSPVYVDMQGIDDEKDFYTTFATTITEKLSLHADIAVENFSGFKQFLKEIEPELGERIIVLMVDEFEELQMRVEDGRISRTIFSNIRHLMQHEEKLIFLFCGTHKIEEMAADYWSIFFNTAVYYRLSRLKPQDAIRLIKEPVKDQLTYDSLAVEQILKMTGAQPYLIQLVCRTLVNALNEKKKRNDALIDDVDDAVDAIIKGGTEHFSQHIWDDATTFERLVLAALAEELTHTQADHMGVDGIYNKIQAVSSSFTRKQMMETLGKLVAREILSEKGIVYGFPVHLLRKWIAARYPLRKVREEI